MDKLALNKGFTLIEMLFVIICISTFSTLTIKSQSLQSVKEISKINLAQKEIIQTKLNALKNHERSCVDSSLFIAQKDICFNENGNVNQGQTLRIAKSTQRLIIHLGSGHYEVK